MFSSMKRRVLRNMRSCTSCSASAALMAGRSRLTTASRVASLSGRLRLSWRVDSRISRLASTATGELAGMRWAQRTPEKRRPCSTIWRGRISDSWREFSR
ncbi:hypothetical protein D9M71_548510 [compost metagenome]